MKNIHPVQAHILLSLLQHSEGSFAELNKENLTNDWFSYHIRQATKKGYIEKSDQKKYYLTTLGKKTALQISSGSMDVLPPQRISVLLLIQKNEKFLIQHRQVEPFKDFWEFPTRRVEFGQSPYEVVKKILYEEIGTEGISEFIGVVHKVEEYPADTSFDDKYYLVFKVKAHKDEYKKEFAGGKNYWLTLEEFLAKEKKHFDVEATLQVLKSTQVHLAEVKDPLIQY